MLALLALLVSGAQASDIEDARDAELERVRGQIANQVQLSAYDLLDEMVYGWISEPVFATPTPVVLAGVTVPVGLGTGLQALLENHLNSLLLENPGSNIQLVHCPSCTAVVVHSGPEGTVVSRGLDNPEVLDDLGGASGRHALFIDIEAEGSWLVLRARITKLTPDLPIVWSHTASTSASTPALLRQPQHLKSAEEAREEYIETLESRGAVTIPLTLGIRTYAQPQGNNAGTAPPPFPWLQSGVELSPTGSQVWRSSFVVGYSFIPQAYQGLMGQARISRLLTGRYRSLTRPDLYLFGGGAVMSVWGPATGSFSNETLTVDQIITSLEGDDPRATFGALHVGLDARIGNRVGVALFFETLPGFYDSRNLGRYFQFAGLEAHSLGTEVSFCF
ncbi:MAG: hypothetical protein GY913_13055 [Proteobacteria bacterium]|nr:hypothetical protein [Pseudomonadota bacterium]MCP4917836.1 hypothetical protein [Pseudomonadota bacterium]